MDDLAPWLHPHQFLGGHEREAARRTRIVLVLTMVTMVAEIGAGMAFNSMALLADGWHMGTHAGALAIAVFAYGFASRHADNHRFAFGTGKVGALGGFASAILLGIVAIMMVVESGERLTTVQTIGFNEALAVAVIGLLVNVASAVVLGGHAHHDHDHGHEHHHDHNLRAAYVHVVADALTSALAIVALLMGKYLGWWWMDPLMGIVGAIVIVRWAVGLARESGAMLLDHTSDDALRSEILSAIEREGDRISDLHLWQVGPGHWAAIISVVTSTPSDPAYYKGLLAQHHELSHVSVEVHSRTR